MIQEDIIVRMYRNNVKLWRILCLLLFNTSGTLLEAAVSTCNAKLYGTSGTFTSPNYPHSPQEPQRPSNSNAFPDNGGFITCEWEIKVPPGNGLQLKFGDFNMRAPLDDCDKGEVEIFTGTGKTKTSLDQYCPGNDPDTVTLRNNSATVVFRRPSKFYGKGFLISFIATPPGETIDDFITCSETGELHGNARSFSVLCPSGCAGIKQPRDNIEGVWGNLLYSDSSRLCQSAVHAGVISDTFGGPVQVRKSEGKVLYRGISANSITAQTGSISTYAISFPATEECHDTIVFKQKQLTASSFWNTTNNYNRRQVWLPQKAIITSPTEAWSPADPTTVQWLQVDLNEYINITGIITQGSVKPYLYTRRFRIKYSRNNITWEWYKERGAARAKVFIGNQNYFSKARNSFVQPTILAKYLRIYPSAVTDEAFRYGLKFSLTGCKLSGTTTTHSSTTTTFSTTKKSTTVSTTSPTTPVSRHASSTPVLTETKMDSLSTVTTNEVTNSVTTATATENSTTSFSVIDVPVDGEVEDDPTKVEPGLNDKGHYIIIIAIVAALAVTSILLAALVLILVRKRKKVTKQETIVPQYENTRTSGTNRSTTGRDTHSGSYKSGDITMNNQKNRSIKTTPPGMEFQNYNDGYFSQTNGSIGASSTCPRGGVISNDQQRQPLVKGNLMRMSSKGSTTPLLALYSTNNDVASTSMLHSGRHHAIPSGDTEGFVTDEDHEYQIIPDHVIEYNANAPFQNSNSSPGEVNNTSEISRSHILGSRWDNVNEAQGKEFKPSSERGHMMTSFSPANLSPLVTSPVIPADFPFSPTVVSHGQSQGSRSPPILSAINATYNSHQRFSMSSNNSSNSPIDAIPSPHYKELTTPYYASVPERQGQLSANGNMEIASNSNKSRKPSYKYPNSNPVEIPIFSVLPDQEDKNENDTCFDATYLNGMNGKNHRSLKSRADSLNHAKLHSGYDQLYRKNSMTVQDNGSSVAGIPPNEYDQLRLNSPL